MASLYIVHFDVNGEVADAKFEFDQNAIAFAKDLEECGYDVSVIDEFASKQSGEYVTIYETESDD